jgi:AcrR family transcriptional regulator
VTHRRVEVCAVNLSGERPRGRPRDPAIDAIVLDSTRELLAEVGFTGTTVQAISRRSGVHPPAIYRRWPSRLALIEDAAFSGLTDLVLEPTGDLRVDLGCFFLAWEQTFATPAARSAIPGLMNAYQNDAPQPPDEWVHFSVRPQFYAILQMARVPEDPLIDVDEVFDLVHGAILGRVLVPMITARHTGIDRFVEMVVRILDPGAAGTSPLTSGRRGAVRKKQRS